MNEQEKIIYGELMASYSLLVEYCEAHQTANHQLRAVMMGMKRTALERDRRMILNKPIVAPPAKPAEAPKKKRTRKKT